MKTELLIAGLSLAVLTTFGCGSKEDDPTATGADDAADDGDDDGDDGSGGVTAGDDGGDDDGEEGEGEEEGAEEEEGSGEGASFLITPDGGGGGIFECDLWTQDCPVGEKCMPWASDGGTWNATRCSELMNPISSVGDDCTAEGGGASGLDSCDVGSMCWDVDIETNTGTCIEMCTGDADNPICGDPATTCSIANGGALILCLPECFPILQDCPDGQGCYPINDVFACAPDVSGEAGAYGDPCEFINVCDPGTACLDPAAVAEPSCAGAGGCCGAYCDLADDAPCPGAALGQECTSPYAEGDVPPGYGDTGWCVIPA